MLVFSALSTKLSACLLLRFGEASVLYVVSRITVHLQLGRTAPLKRFR